MLSYDVNPFRGAVIDSGSLPQSADDFSHYLAETIEQIRSETLDLIWLYLPYPLAALVPVAVKAGFFYHHADINGLQLILKVVSEAFVPEYATHYIGVGGVLLDEHNRLLVIQEKHHQKKHYKLPGGAVDPGEHLAAAAVREVFEETGIRSEFLTLNCFRHWHGYRHGKSDIYFVCRLKPLSFEITPDPREITEARWMPLTDYLTDPDTHPFNRKIVETTVSTPGLRPEGIDGYGSPETHEMMFGIPEID